MGKITEIDQRRTIAGSNALAPVTCNLIPDLENALSILSPLPHHALYPGIKAKMILDAKGELPKLIGSEIPDIRAKMSLCRQNYKYSHNSSCIMWSNSTH
jgi:hypothetical protein